MSPVTIPFPFSVVDLLRSASSCLAGGIRRCFGFQRNTSAVLTSEMAKLRAIWIDTKKDVQVQGVPFPKICTRQVQNWIDEVDCLMRDVENWENKINSPVYRVLCFQECSCWSADFLERARDLTRQRETINQLVFETLPAVEAIPSSFSASSIPSRIRALQEIQGYLFNDDVGIIGIYGMGGIGKTTLLKIFNNELLQPAANNPFDVVIWVTVSRDLNVNKVREDIAKRLGMNLSSVDSRRRRHELYNVLLKKRFLLLLDDVWERLDLVEEVGIPPLDKINKCKVVLTTRSGEVCDQMAAKKVKLDVLNQDESSLLFDKQIGREVDRRHPLIQPNIEKAFARCGGLPLALNVVGRAMANAKTCHQWEDAVEQLTRYPNDNSGGMAAEVFSSLKFSFDRLENDKLRQCFLYCSLFPHDRDIEVEDLVEKWMGEGLVDGRNECHTYIMKLKDACLLESGMNEECVFDLGISFRLRFVRMHDVIREMALRLTANGERLVLYHGASLERWEEAKWVSMKRHNDAIEWPNEMPNCPNMQTLLMGYSILETIPSHIFSTMVKLRVLDLSGTNIEVLPPSVGSLVQLRYLNLSCTKIRSLPQELGDLVELTQLHMESVARLQRIPRQTILSLTKLQTMNISHN